MPIGRHTSTTFGRVHQNVAPGYIVCYLRLTFVIFNVKRMIILVTFRLMSSVINSNYKCISTLHSEVWFVCCRYSLGSRALGRMIPHMVNNFNTQFQLNEVTLNKQTDTR